MLHVIRRTAPRFSLPCQILYRMASDASASAPPAKMPTDANTTQPIASKTLLPDRSKSEKELKKEREKAEKLAKFEEKQKKKQQSAQTKQPQAAKDKKSEVIQYVEETPKGQKKILKPLDSEQLKSYQPNIVESAWYSWWESQGYFKPVFDSDKGRFVIVIPPPNVTGKLHVGHALATALQDVLIRFYRMKGLTVLYLPGTDHAGISTQSVIEVRLYREQGKTRHDLGREKFLETVQQWKEDTRIEITKTLQRLGASLDWSREAFTMDENLSRAVAETFITLFEEGLIYRSSRLVNWCSALSTALSTIEVDNKELNGRTMLDVPGYARPVEFGVLTHFTYPIDGSESETIEVATTRPETMLGDTGIAVNPKDERFAHLVGRSARHPFTNRLMPIVADDYVDKEFGTGAVKITPAHDLNDWELGKRHGFEVVNILNDDGTMNQNAGSYKGMKRFDVRWKVIEDMKKNGMWVKAVDNPMRVPLCQRSKDVIEFLPKPQWWMSMKQLAEPALAAVQSGEIKIKPESARKNYEHWMSNINDWCLSRQLWWGHQIPAYRVLFDDTRSTDEDETFVVAHSEQEAQKKAQSKFAGREFTLRRDEDVLDTWFSSGLWPFSTLGWPQKTVDLEKLFPTALLETGWDILFFWVARMVMFSLKLTGKVPFTEVFCHGLIRDSDGRKMSKSLGNVIDPVDIMNGITLPELHAKLRIGNLDPKEVTKAEAYQKKAFPKGIPQCGADALRLTLIDYVTPSGGDIAFDIKVMEAYRRFCNKVYQASKFLLGGQDFSSFTPSSKPSFSDSNFSSADIWILSQLDDATRNITRALENRDFSHATQAAFHYFRDSLCDVYIEYTKQPLRSGTDAQKNTIQQTLYTALEGGLLLLHPFMPFLTEELWQRLPRRQGDKTESIMVAAFPEPNDAAQEKKDVIQQFEASIQASNGIKSLASTSKLNKPVFAVKLSKNSLQIDVKDVLLLCQYVKPALSEGSLKVLSAGEEVQEDAQSSEQEGLIVYALEG